MDPAYRPLAIMVPLIVATAVRARSFASGKSKRAGSVTSLTIVARALVDGVAASGVLEAAVVITKSGYIMLCVVGAVLPAIATVVDLWFDAGWAQKTKWAGVSLGGILSVIGAALAVADKDINADDHPQAAAAFASVLPSLMGIF